MNQLLKTNRQTKLTPRMKIRNIFVNSRIYELNKQLKNLLSIWANCPLLYVISLVYTKTILDYLQWFPNNIVLKVCNAFGNGQFVIFY